MVFEDQYKHPKWQKKRAQIMKRDSYTCRLCDSEDRQLNVHHRYYERNKMVWDYPSGCFLTVCYSCHEFLHETQKELNKAISRIDPNDLLAFSKSDLKKVSRLLVNGELDAVKRYAKKLKYNGS